MDKVSRLCRELWMKCLRGCTCLLCGKVETWRAGEEVLGNWLLSLCRYVGWDDVRWALLWLSFLVTVLLE
jgi:hypothetical protein